MGDGKMERPVPVSLGSPVFVARETGGLMITAAWFPGGATLPPHVHDRPTFAVILDGGFTLGFTAAAIRRRWLDCPAGTVLTEPAGERHTNLIGRGGARALVLQPDPTRDDLPCGTRTVLEGISHFRDGEVALAARRLRREVELSVAVATAFVGFRLLWYQAFNPYPMTTPPGGAWFWQIFRESFIHGFVLYWAILGVYHALTNYALYRQRDLEAARMQAQLAETRLQALRSQLRPHFLFNTLNTASAVLERDPAKARTILGRLGELLRASLAADDVQEVPLARELSVAKAVIEIEEARFGDRLTVEVDVPPDLHAALVPSFVLQPLIENAVRYGIAPRAEPGRVRVRATRRGEVLELSVWNDGPGIPEGRVVEGIGLGNTRKRLATLYDKGHVLSLRNPPAGGLEVMVQLPYRTAMHSTWGELRVGAR